MAIYSCNLKSVGKTTHAPGTAGAYIRYISRPAADPTLLSEHIPLDSVQARTWMDGRERAMRKNARVIDKIRLAIPRELSPEERAALVREFMDELTGGRVPWYAAIHQSGKDAHNPHAHIAVHDRSVDTGKRALRLSDNARDREKAGLPGPKAVDWIRERWEVQANKALERAGSAARIDRRTLEAQGIDRTPTIHEGPGARYVHQNIRRPDSRARVNGAGRKIDYPAIDAGKLRREYNAQIIDFNLARAARSSNPVTAAWAAFEKEQIAKDRALEERLAAARQQRTAERRSVSRDYTEKANRVRAEARTERQKALTALQRDFKGRRAAMQTRHADERNALRARHRTLAARVARRFSRRLKDRQLDQRKRQIAEHRRERAGLSREYRAARDETKAVIRARYQPELEQISRDRKDHLARLRKEHRQAARQDDGMRQERETDREHARQLLEGKIRTMPSDAAKAVESQKSSALDRALEKAQKQERNRPSKEKGEGRKR